MKRAITEIHKKCWGPKEIYAYWYVGKLPFHQNLRVPRPSGHFHIDGWMGWMDGMDGWMDGWVGLLFFGFVYFSKTTSYIILIVSGPQRRHFQVSFVKK